MNNEELLRALGRLKVETGSLACLGCGHEHSCSARGCAIIRAAVEALRAYMDTGLEPEKIRDLAVANKEGRLLVASMPIGTRVYQLGKGQSEETRIIDGEVYTRRVPNWYVTHHEYSWIDAMVDAENPDRIKKPNCRYYFTKEDAFAERDRINAGGDPYARHEQI